MEGKEGGVEKNEVVGNTARLSTQSKPDLLKWNSYDELLHDHGLP